MKYTHTLDVGAAIKAYHVIWNNPNLWSDIIIHLGDFHAINAYFGAIGTFGFEDILFQAGHCSPGSLNRGCLKNIITAAGYYTNRFQKH